MSQKANKEFTAYIEELGAKPLKKENGRSYTHTLNTDVGLLYLYVDTEGPVNTLFGNFLDDVQEAKNKLGHWKYNLHKDKKADGCFKESIKAHLSYVK